MICILLTLGYVESTFDLVWVRTVNNGEEEVLLDTHSTATLYELDMPEEPIRTRLLIRENQTGPPEKVKVCVLHFCYTNNGTFARKVGKSQ